MNEHTWRIRLARLLDPRPRINRYERVGGSWFVVDDEGNVWVEQWRATLRDPEAAAE